MQRFKPAPEQPYKKPDKHAHRGKTDNYQPKSRGESSSPLTTTPRDHSFQAFWEKLSFKQKIGLLICLAIGAGLTAVAIYQLLPYFTQIASSSNNAHPQKYNFFNESRKADFFKKIAKTPIRTEEKLEKALRNAHPLDTSAAFYKEKITKQTSQVRENLPQATHPEVLEKVVSQDNFSVQIEHHKSLDNAGKYDTRTNTLHVAVDLADDPSFSRLTYLNEMHHAAVTQRNKAFQTSKDPQSLPRDDYSVALPFMKDKWEVDRKLMARLDKAITSAEKRINDFMTLHGKVLNRERLDPKETEAYERYLASITDYKPRISMVALENKKAAEFSALLKKTRASNAIYEIPQSKLYPLPKGSMDTKAYITEVVKDDVSGEYQFHYRFSKDDSQAEKVTAFLADFREYEHRYSSSVLYGNMSLEHKLTEKSSDIEEYRRGGFPLVFFEKWCEYFSEYHTVKQYCLTA